MTGLFNNREIASFIIIFVFMAWALTKSEVRSPIWAACTCLFDPKVLSVFLVIGLYIGGICVAAKEFVTLGAPEFKCIFYWLVGASFPMIIQIGSVPDKTSNLRRAVRDLLGITILVEFLVGFVAFPLLAELTGILFISVLSAMSIMAARKSEHAVAKKVIDTILVTIGLFLLCYSIWILFNETPANKLLRTATLSAIPIVLFVFYIPFLYLILLSFTYESQFVLVNHFLKQDRTLARYLKFKLFLYCKLNMRKIGDIGIYQEFNLVRSRDEVRQVFGYLTDDKS